VADVKRRGTTSLADQLSQDLPVSRGQWKAIASAACVLLGHAEPKSRYEASVLLTRLRQAGADDRRRA
jgi:hypothetical protein